jgi:hypothetical protein
MTAEELKKRTKQFALRILKLVSALPNNLQGKTVGGQLVRAGTSVGHGNIVWKSSVSREWKPAIVNLQ